MPKICYVKKSFSPEKLKLIDIANQIAIHYAEQGYDLTLRQLYYQFVARAIIPNKDEEYSKLGDLISDARLAGLMDWNHIIDRTRSLRQNAHWDHPAKILDSAASTFAMDKWATQKHYVEVWVEKDALVDVIGQTASRLDCPYFSCRGYTSQSAMWEAGQRILKVIKSGRTPHIIHLGDHDPSGMDMSRDIFARLNLFCGTKVHVLRAALNRAQIDQYNPPPNPAKVTDSRFKDYQEKHGDSSWELDALDPLVLAGIIQRAVAMFMDQAEFDKAKAKEERGRSLLRKIRERWSDVVRFLGSDPTV